MASSSKGVPPAVLLFAACSFWGIATVLNKVLLDSIPPLLLLFLQLLASTAFLWAACICLGKSLPSRRILPVAVALGVLNPGVSYTFSMLGLERITASVTSLLWATEPLLIVGLAWLILREPITSRIAAVIALGFTGVILVSGLLSDAAGLGGDITGIVFLFLAVLMCAFYTVYSRKISESADVLSLVTIQQTSGLVWSAGLFAVTSEGNMMDSLANVQHSTLIYAMLTGLMYYAVAYWLYLAVLSRVSAALAGASFNLIPIVTVTVAFVFLGERLNGLQIAGALLILVSASALFWLTRTPARAA